MVHSGMVGFAIRIITNNIPIKNPYNQRPLFVHAEVTGSVARNTMPNAKPPRTRCQYHGMLNIGLLSLPMILNIMEVRNTPINPPAMIRQDAIPV